MSEFHAKGVRAPTIDDLLEHSQMAAHGHALSMCEALSDPTVVART